MENKYIKLFDVMATNKDYAEKFLDHANSYMISHQVALRFRILTIPLSDDIALYIEVPFYADEEIQKKFAMNYIFMTMGVFMNP